MRKALSTILLAAMLLALSACGGEKNQNVELTVFAAAPKQMNELDEVGSLANGSRMDNDTPGDFRRTLARFEEDCK